MRLLSRRRSPARVDWRVTHQVAAWCLGYPDENLFGRLDLMRAALAEQEATEASDPLHRFLTHAETGDRAALAQHYTDVFDLSRKRTLYLSYWSSGDTRQRGAVLAEFKQLYRDSGFVVDLHGELPDHLPIVLEFTALADPERGASVLADHRAALELIRFALLDAASPYADVLAAVCATLPGDSPPDRAAAIAMGPRRPAVEAVGLEPYGSWAPTVDADGSPAPRLLPLFTDTESTDSELFTDPGLFNDSEKAF
ncbi:nitrate reductase molybdenum cofactor assembly chaperone [Gordonia hydrophobica]|uniref:Nitrate reductase molybdenum cofactor assembly chaperone n=1 Tax=Gordonia hydrophobica TaxID=40516 RepID=A0ABZ2TX29_9ACTN|nr:nitrate reductase molybdenum cofactor assembly chaperone [Gordonia hydrophobica]MBM7369317.1 nitrate reductase delta subunit [Gordonia hydrophobica]